MNKSDKEKLYKMLKNIQEWKETSKEEREMLIDKKYIIYSEDSKKSNFEWIKMPYKLTKKWEDFIDETETITL